MTEKIALLIELFGWRVVRVRHNVGKVTTEEGPRRVAMVWELASRWSPPPVTIALLFLVDEEGELIGLEVGVIHGDARVAALAPPRRYRVAVDARGVPVVGDPLLESFVAQLGSFRTNPEETMANGELRWP